MHCLNLLTNENYRKIGRDPIETGNLILKQKKYFKYLTKIISFQLNSFTPIAFDI